MLLLVIDNFLNLKIWDSNSNWSTKMTGKKKKHKCSCKYHLCNLSLSPWVCLLTNESFPISLCLSVSFLQVFLITLVQLVSKQSQRNSMNAWCFALPIVPTLTIHSWTLSQVFISDPNLQGRKINNVHQRFFGRGRIKNSRGRYCHVVGILIYPDSTRQHWPGSACRMSFVFPSSLPCIINKWHPDFIKVPGPLWLSKVTGGHFNMSREHLSRYYLRQPVAPEEGRKKRGAMSRVTAAWKAVWCRNWRTVLSKSKCIHSRLRLFSHSSVLTEDPLFPPVHWLAKCPLAVWSWTCRDQLRAKQTKKFLVLIISSSVKWWKRQITVGCTITASLWAGWVVLLGLSIKREENACDFIRKSVDV